MPSVTYLFSDGERFVLGPPSDQPNTVIFHDASGGNMILAVPAADGFSFDVGATAVMVMSSSTLQSGSAAEVAFCVTNEALAIGTEGSVVIPYLEQTGALFTDGIGGDLDGCIGINCDTDSGPVDTIEAQVGGAWVSAALSGTNFPSSRHFDPNGVALYHPDQIFVGEPWQVGELPEMDTYIDESRCAECGENMEVGHTGVFYANVERKNGDLHNIYSHLHGNNDFKNALREALTDSTFKKEMAQLVKETN